MNLAPLSAILCVFPLSALADPVVDALDAAKAAYEAGDLGKAIDETGEATSAMQLKQSEALAVFLPDAPDGWTKTINPDMAAGLAYVGGGSGVEASYQNDAVTFSISMIADSPMLESMLPMFQDPNMLAMMGEVVTIGDQAFIKSAETEMMTAIGSNLMLTASGADPATMTPLLEGINFAALADFVSGAE